MGTYRGTHYRPSRLRAARRFIRDHGPCILAAAIGGAIAFLLISALVVPHIRGQ